jgi:phage FluMu protein Com
MPNGGKQAKYFYLYYIDDNPEEIAVVVEDFFDFYLYYEQYVKGGRLIRCSECGKLVLSQSKTKHELYCKKCQKQKQYEWEQQSRKSSK